MKARYGIAGKLDGGCMTDRQVYTYMHARWYIDLRQAAMYPAAFGSVMAAVDINAPVSAGWPKPPSQFVI